MLALLSPADLPRLFSPVRSAWAGASFTPNPTLSGLHDALSAHIGKAFGALDGSRPLPGCGATLSPALDGGLEGAKDAQPGGGLPEDRAEAGTSPRLGTPFSRAQTAALGRGRPLTRTPPAAARSPSVYLTRGGGKRECKHPSRNRQLRSPHRRTL